MCLIAWVPAGKTMPDDNMVAAHRNNNDGIGIMSADGVHKFLGRKALPRAKRYIATLVERNIEHAIHFRYATHGAVTAANCHPFELPNGHGWLMHNGILSAYTSMATREHSDTYFFTQDITNSDASNTENDKHLDYWSDIAGRIGGNKLVVMLPDYRFILVNHSMGKYIDDIWYSQTYSLPDRNPRTSSPYVGSGYTGMYGAGYYREGWDSERGSYLNRGGYGGFTSYADWQARQKQARDNQREPRALIGWRRHVDPETKSITYEKVVDGTGTTDSTDPVLERLNAAHDRRGTPKADADKASPWAPWDRDKDGNDVPIAGDSTALDQALATELAKQLQTNCVLCFKADLPVDPDGICEDCLRQEAQELDKGALLTGWATVADDKKSTEEKDAGVCIDCGGKHDFVTHWYCGGAYCIGAGYKDQVNT